MCIRDEITLLLSQAQININNIIIDLRQVRKHPQIKSSKINKKYIN